MRATAKEEVAMLIAEDRTIVRKMLKLAHTIQRGRAPLQLQQELESILADGNNPLLNVLPLDRIVESVHFAEKNESSLLQVADVCAFAIKRKIMNATHADRLYDPLKDQILFTPSVVKALSSTVQPS
jgi:hypothetical protein